MEKKTVVILGVTSNQAQAINLALEEIKKLKSRDEAPLAKFTKDNDSIVEDLAFFTDIHANMKDHAKKLIRKVEERIERLQKYKSQVGEQIEKYKGNVEYLETYINDVKSHIVEEVFEDKVVYTYDTKFFDTWLGLASIMFEFEVEVDKK